MVSANLECPLPCSALSAVIILLRCGGERKGKQRRDERLLNMSEATEDATRTSGGRDAVQKRKKGDGDGAVSPPS